MADRPVAVVAGVGPGTGLALCRALAQEGYVVAAQARRAEALAELVKDHEHIEPFACDVTDAEAVSRSYAAIREQLGQVEVLFYNAGSGVFRGLDQLEAADLERAWRINTQGLFLAAKQVVPAMREAQNGTIGITGATASLRGKPVTLAFAQAKAAQRSLAQSLARDLGPDRIHVFYAIIDGMIQLQRDPDAKPPVPGAPDTGAMPEENFLLPDDIAKAYVQMLHQPSSAWTFEFTLRPFSEKW